LSPCISLNSYPILLFPFLSLS